MAAVTLPTTTAYDDGDAASFDVWEYDDLGADFIKFCQAVTQLEPGQYLIVEDDSSSIGYVLIADDPADFGIAETE